MGRLKYYSRILILLLGPIVLNLLLEQYGVHIISYLGLENSPWLNSPRLFIIVMILISIWHLLKTKRLTKIQKILFYTYYGIMVIVQSYFLFTLFVVNLKLEFWIYMTVIFFFFIFELLIMSMIEPYNKAIEE